MMDHVSADTYNPNCVDFKPRCKNATAGSRDDALSKSKTNNLRICGAISINSLREIRDHGIGIRRSSLYDLEKNNADFEYGDLTRKDAEDISRSQYSLVSCGELSPAALELWHGLPEEVKYDPALAPFRRFYEKEHGTTDNTKSPRRHSAKRLPLVNSAPHLNNNLQIIDEAVPDQSTENVTEINKNNDRGIEMPISSADLAQKMSKMEQAIYYTKMTLLLACWVFFTIVFIMYGEQEVVTRQSYITPGDTKEYSLKNTVPDLSVFVEMTGPFLSEQSEQKLDAKEYANISTMNVWLQRTTSKGQKQNSKVWSVLLDESKNMDFSVGEVRSSLLEFKKIPNNTGKNAYAIHMKSNSKNPLPFSMTYTEQPLNETTGVILSLVLLVGLYALIIFEIINRTMAAVIVATTALAVLSLVGQRPSLPELISWLDVETLLLLFSMMVLVALMAETGMFDFLAVFTFSVTKGKIWPLIILLCSITAILSTFLDNVTTVLLMTPVTIRLCEVMELNPVPVLISMVLYSNIGGTATPVGDPPNVIIASNKLVISSGIHFTNFTIHMTLGIILICVQTYYQLRYIYKDINKLRINVPSDIQDLRLQINIWKRASNSLPNLSKDEHVVKNSLEKKIKKLNDQLAGKVVERNKTACPKDTFQTTLDVMKEKYKIRDKGLLIKSTIAIVFVVTVFFLHSIPELRRVSLGWTALLGAILLLILADREDLEPILHRVEWSTLLFFAALFVLMEALSKLGLIVFIGGWVQFIIMSVDEKYRLAIAILLILWVSGITSAFVDNIPLTTMMVRVVTALGTNANVGLPLSPLIWALGLGACLGGNGTLIGASANVVCAGVAEQHGYRISFMEFFKVGFPIMFGHLIIASGYLLLCHCVFTWH